MMKNRVYDMPQTTCHGPYHMRHVICPARVVSHDDGVIGAQANHAVFRTSPGSASEVYHVGCCVGEIVAKKKTAR